MNEPLSHYLRTLSDPEIPVGLSDVERLMKEYPFFTLPALTLMQREGSALPAETRSRLLGQIALNAPDPAAFAALSDSRRDTWLNFYPPEKKAPVTTENAIDTFLNTYGHSSPEEDRLLERLIFNPTADYSAVLEREEPLPTPSANPTDPQAALIDSFIMKQQGASTAATSAEDDTKASTPPSESPEPAGNDTPPGPVPPAAQPTGIKPPSDIAVNSGQTASPPPAATPSDHPTAVHETASDTSLSESLAKIYIRRRRYDKAFEIIHGLSLNNPKKSVYFADQLRFLRKLMLNSSLSEQNKPSN
ncbi:hypothetical protein [uncultured Duncaniella sp.]|uniref:hypothetical protein n=1 Tax=uncultured Duncaniella sp. TaxID=2768039 RepID=UPI00272C749B|nr:hypothetical protein [uncultured Duncaniella sp.]